MWKYTNTPDDVQKKLTREQWKVIVDNWDVMKSSLTHNQCANYEFIKAFANGERIIFGAFKHDLFSFNSNPEKYSVKKELQYKPYEKVDPDWCGMVVKVKNNLEIYKVIVEVDCGADTVNIAHRTITMRDILGTYLRKDSYGNWVPFGKLVE